MRNLLLCLWLAASMHCGIAYATAQAQEFTYQGRLQLNGQPANGTFPMTFALFDASSGGNQVGSTVSKPSVNVNAGSFTVILSYPGAFTGDQLWLEITVNGQTLASRQTVTATPVSQFTLNGGMAMDYIDSSPSSAVTPPRTALGTIGPFNLSASCGIAGDGAVTLAVFANSDNNYDSYLNSFYQINDAGALTALPNHFGNLSGLQAVQAYVAASGNYLRVWVGPWILRSRGATKAVVSGDLYIAVDARAASTGCVLEGTATSGV